MKIAALFVDQKGVYSQFSDIDLWDELRDARQYKGSHPVVAHPPCQLWGAMAPINYKRWGGDHNKPGNDQGCFQSALDSVNTFYGVLEHPAKTKAWAAHGLLKPVGLGWKKIGYNKWVCEVWQSAYGHKANKATWLYYHGLASPIELRWERPKGTHQIGFHDQRGKDKNKPTISGKQASATPKEFAEILINIALHAITKS